MPSFGKKLSSDADRAGGVVRLVGRAQLGNELRLQARQDDDRRVRAERQAVLLPAGVRQPDLPGGAREGARAAGDRRLAASTAVHADCHQISHWIGRAGLVYYKHDAGQALSHGAMTCNSGYYHGVLQVALAGLPRNVVVKKSQHLCSAPAVNTEEFLLYQCVHGLGHGLMIYSGDDLPWSLRTCHKLLTDFDRVSCTGGVFMQNLDTTMGTSRYLKPKDPIYPCNTVVERDKVYCYLMVTSRINTLDGYNWRKTADWCRRSERGWVETCFESYGRDASGSSEYDPAKTIALCLQAGPNASDCIYGAARDYGNNYAGGPDSSRFCAAAPARFRPRCYEGIGTILGAMHRYGAERRRRATGRRRRATGPTATAAPRSRSARRPRGARVALEPAPQAGALHGDDATRARDPGRRRRRRRHRLRHRAGRRVEPQLLRGALPVAGADHGGQRRAAAELRARVPDREQRDRQRDRAAVRGRRLRRRLLERGRRARRRSRGAAARSSPSSAAWRRASSSPRRTAGFRSRRTRSSRSSTGSRGRQPTEPSPRFGGATGSGSSC